MENVCAMFNNVTARSFKFVIVTIVMLTAFTFLYEICEGAVNVQRNLKKDISQPLKKMKAASPGTQKQEIVIPLGRRAASSRSKAMKQESDQVRQSQQGKSNISEEIIKFKGLTIGEVLDSSGWLLTPPDTQGDVGPNHYVQWVNTSFSIYDKKANRLYGPASGNTLWSGFGGICETTNNGDVITLYDAMADRWFMSQFAYRFDEDGYMVGPYYQCIAVSQTPDPLGAWYRYEFKISDKVMNDYPKFGVWPDAYYMSINNYLEDTGNFVSAGVAAFERDKMLQGLEASIVYFDLADTAPDIYSLLPSNLNGQTLPPDGAPNNFTWVADDSWGYDKDKLEIWAFHVDWATPSESTFTKVTQLDVAPFVSDFIASKCGNNKNDTNNTYLCITQPGTDMKLDSLSDRLMYRLQYRNFSSHQSMVVNHTVNADGQGLAGIRWYELRKDANDWYIYQQGTYAPNSTHRWIGSIAMDGAGNLALGYSASSKTLYPSVRHTGRLASDPLNTMTQEEVTIFAGTGSQLSEYGRWGDYSTMSVDPSDDCTFWYTQEFYDMVITRGWKTIISSFRYPSCTPAIVVDLKANGNGGVVRTKVTEPVSLTIGVKGAPAESVNAKWYLEMQTPDGTMNYYNLTSNTWTSVAENTYYLGPVVNIESLEIAKISKLSEGYYKFKFMIAPLDGAGNNSVISDAVTVKVD